jgi:hypothetical protein
MATSLAAAAVTFRSSEVRRGPRGDGGRRWRPARAPSAASNRVVGTFSTSTTMSTAAGPRCGAVTQCRGTWAARTARVDVACVPLAVVARRTARLSVLAAASSSCSSSSTSSSSSPLASTEGASTGVALASHPERDLSREEVDELTELPLDQLCGLAAGAYTYSHFRSTSAYFAPFR